MFAVLCFVKIITFHCIWGGGGGFVVKYLLVAEFQFALIWQKQVDTEEEEEKEDSPATKDTVSSDFINREIESHLQRTTNIRFKLRISQNKK